jgi:hypothetical protein
MLNFRLVRGSRKCFALLSASHAAYSYELVLVPKDLCFSVWDRRPRAGRFAFNSLGLFTYRICF